MRALSILTGLAAFGAALSPSVSLGQNAEAAPVVPEAARKVDVNSADIPTLEAIPEIGTNFANAVVAARPFNSVYELQPILRISAEKMVELHAKVTALAPKVPSPLATKPAAAPTTSPVPITASTQASALAADQERAEARRRHIRRDALTMSESPPAARAEVQPESPGKNYVWKPGHWAPAKGEWKWTPGEWAVPPTSISVWIEGNYDSKTQRWSPGYWEPDKIQLSESDTSTKR